MWIFVSVEAGRHGLHIRKVAICPLHVKGKDALEMILCVARTTRRPADLTNHFEDWVLAGGVCAVRPEDVEISLDASTCLSIQRFQRTILSLLFP
jgi:hypothetical protein